MSLAVISAIIMTVLLIVMLVMGASISIAIGLSSAVAMLCMLPVDISLITSAQRIFTGANSFSLIAIPFFILAGNIMNNGGIAVRLVNVAKVLSGRMPGALAQSNVVANMMFGAISGSGAAAAAARRRAGAVLHRRLLLEAPWVLWKSRRVMIRCSARL